MKRILLAASILVGLPLCANAQSQQKISTLTPLTGGTGNEWMWAEFPAPPYTIYRVTPNTLPIEGAGQTTARTLGNWMGDTINAKGFGAALNGITDDLAAFNAARTAAGAGGIVFVPPGGIQLSGNPTAGPSTPILWQLSGNTGGVTTNPALYIGGDITETYLYGGGGKFFGRQSTLADAGPMVRLDSTATNTGGTSGYVVPTLQINTTIPYTGTNLNDYVWGISSILHSQAVGPGEHVGIASSAYHDHDGSQVWAGLSALSDTTGHASSASGALVTHEFDLSASGSDDGGASYGLIPSGQGIRSIIDADFTTVGTYGWGVRVQGPPVGTVTVHRPFAINNITVDIAGFDTAYATFTGGAPAYHMASGQLVCFDTASHQCMLWNSGGSVWQLTSSGTAVVAVDTNGNTSLHTVSAQPGSTQVAYAVAGTAGAVGFDASGATLSGPALRVAAGQKIALDAGAVHTLTYDSGTGKLFYAVSGVNKFSIDASGNVKAAGTITASTTP